ncbi:MAG: Hsp20/alpha crystallin family protein [Bacteroidota bacterium]
MTLLRVYKKNGYPAQSNEGAYRFSDMFKDFFGEDQYTHSTPKVNVIEEKEFYELEIALPGVSKEDIAINIDKDSLTISHREKEASEEEGIYSRKEFDFSRFNRSFQLPETINIQKVDAKMENGVLKVKLPKRDEAIDKGPREIKIS